MTGVSEGSVEIVNVVGSGTLDIEIDLDALAEDIPEGEYNPANYHGMYLRFGDDAPLVTLYRSGKYIVTGANSTEELFEIRSKVLERLTEIGIVLGEIDDGFVVQNFVCQGDTGQTVNLDAAAIGLGLEQTEYEPEQFPGLIYRPDGCGCVLVLFANGKVIITGASEIGIAQQAFTDLLKRLEDSF